MKTIKIIFVGVVIAILAPIFTLGSILGFICNSFLSGYSEGVRISKAAYYWILR